MTETQTLFNRIVRWIKQRYFYNVFTASPERLDIVSYASSQRLDSVFTSSV